MDYSRITEDIILERYESLPDEIQEILNSEEERRIAQAIGKTQYLDQKKMETFELLVGFTLLGFIHPRELAHEISEELFLNFDHSRSLVDELEKRLFASVQKQLEQVYTPLPAETEEEIPLRSMSGSTVSLNVFPKSNEDLSIRSVPVQPQKSRSDSAEIKPFILHEEKEIVERMPSSGKKGFSLPFQFFRSSMTSAQNEKNPTRVEIELPSTKRVVHYSENSTPLPPMSSISITSKTPASFPPITNPKVDPNLKPSPRSLPGFPRPTQNVPVDLSGLDPKNTKPGQEKPTPKIQGNMVDLR